MIVLVVAAALAGQAVPLALSCPSKTKHREFRFSNGSREEWCVDSNGLRHGPALSRYPNGVLTSDGAYSSGRVDSTWRYFFNDGVKWREEQWYNGELKSSWVNPIVYTLSPEEHEALGAVSSHKVDTKKNPKKKGPE